MTKILLILMTLLASTYSLPVAGASPCLEDKAGDTAFVTAYIDAFNSHDVEAMRKMWAKDIQWVDISGAEAVVISNGADALAQSMASYFESFPGVRSEVSKVVVSGNLLAFSETASWGRRSDRQSQQALAVYDVRGGRIHRFWYIAGGPEADKKSGTPADAQ